MEVLYTKPKGTGSRIGMGQEGKDNGEYSFETVECDFIVLLWDIYRYKMSALKS